MNPSGVILDVQFVNDQIFGMDPNRRRLRIFRMIVDDALATAGLPRLGSIFGRPRDEKNYNKKCLHFPDRF